MANRGTEIFVAIGNRIRWADLAKTHAQWEQDPDNSDQRPSYRSLSAPVYYTIRQLIISPSGHFLAICTDYTVQVAVLPDHSRLSEQDQSTLKLKTYQLGPTIHVLPGSPLASVLWHPFADATTSTDCLVTVTAEAAVRLWTLDRTNQNTFGQPELAIDLRKLADGSSCDQDFAPSGFGKTKGFSVDDFDMEVAASCFGGTGAEDEDPWASMTLWTAMKNGDLYALCPLLPPRWRPTSTTIPSLSTSAVSRMATIATENVEPDERRAANQQYEWVSEIDSDEPPYDEVEQQSELRHRPLNPSAIPRLQGPFDLGVNDEIDVEITDIFVFPPRLDEDDIYSGEDEFKSGSPSGLPYTTIVVGGSDGSVHIALDLEGVSGQWLPKQGRSTFSVPMAESRALVLLVTTDLNSEQPSNGSPKVGPPFVSLTLDAVNRYTLFASVQQRVVSISLDEWVSRLGMELSPEVEADVRLKTRLETTCQNRIAVVDTVIDSKEALSQPLSAPVILDDLEVGYLVLTHSSSSPYAAKLDQAHLAALSLRQSMTFSASRNQLQSGRFDGPSAADSPDVPPSRAVYAPSRTFDVNPAVPIESLKQRLPASQKRILSEQPMRLSPALLDVMSSAHRTISTQTADLETAAAELFRRCERLREELGEQVKQMSELADQLQRMQNSGIDDLRPGEERLSQGVRIERSKDKQKELNKRFEEVRRKVGKVSSSKRELSTKETAWIMEIEQIGDRVGLNATSGASNKDSLHARFQIVSGPPPSCV